MSSEHAIKCIVVGRVQGVWFRGSTREQALKLGLTGYARNLPNGSVEVLARGPGAALATLQAWLRRGPPSARVDGLQCAQVVDPVSRRVGFEIG